LELKGDDPLQGRGLHLLQNALIGEEIIEVAADIRRGDCDRLSRVISGKIFIVVLVSLTSGNSGR